ncbi:MAG: S-layer homology domain-containing protein [Clostridia bacterium]|nr:S-layer homology domain-containing protein [Clostridia bacterium]MBO4428386.1 S-layer homology domain-containing protein [Clostridia bacterium]
MRKEGSKMMQAALCVVTVVMATAIVAFGGEASEASAAKAVWEVVDIADSEAKNEIVALAGDGTLSLEESGGFYYFHPSEPLTREYMAATVAKFARLDASAYKDVPLNVADAGEISEADAELVKAAVFCGIMPVYSESVDGDEALYFRPNDALTREEAVRILSKLVNASAASSKINAYGDTDEISDACRSAVEKFVGLDILVGYGDGTLRPKQTMTREEFAIILFKIKSSGYLDLQGG